LTLFPNDWPVVVPSGSCAGMMKHHYPTLFAADPVRKAQAEKLSARIYELTDFLVNVLDWQAARHGNDCTVVLHTSCSARREMGVHLTGRQLLGGLKNVNLAQQDHESECCGFGGTFSIKQPEISGAMVEDKVKALEGDRRRARRQRRLRLPDEHPRPRRLEGCAGRPPNPSLPGEHIASFLLRRTSPMSARDRILANCCQGRPEPAQAGARCCRLVRRPSPG
jgi:L-lactate dehydrogenase complex protein LldE